MRSVVRTAAGTAFLVSALVLAGCGPAPDRVGPDRARLTTDDLARSALEATGSALGLPSDQLRGVADARRCDDEATARHQVDASFDEDITNLATTGGDLVRALRSAGLDPEESTDGADHVIAGEHDGSTWQILLGPQEQRVTVRSDCLDVGRVQAVEIAFAERYSVRPGKPSPDR